MAEIVHKKKIGHRLLQVLIVMCYMFNFRHYSTVLVTCGIDSLRKKKNCLANLILVRIGPPTFI
jgi:hypothetical protein